MTLTTKFSVVPIILLISFSAGWSQQLSPVAINGQLHITGTRLLNEHNKAVQLRGMSLFWSQWQPQYFNYETLAKLKNNWHVNVVRAPMAIENGGYLTNSTQEKKKIFAVIDAAIKLGIYVIVDWHDHHAENHRLQAVAFFAEVSKKYGNTPNIIYETFNEPLDISWANVLKPYHEAIIAAIRKTDHNNVIVCGTPTWSQKLLEAAKNPIDAKNIAYTLHFYAGTHKEKLRDDAQKAIDLGLPVFVTEFGTTEANGDGAVYVASTNAWFDFINKNNLSWCNWSLADKKEGSAALLPGTRPEQLNRKDVLTPSGKLIKAKLALINP
ncbi:endoglucanase [Pedobacter sp. UYP30]|uniref:glycoside hydrolase family 5 protein n=1 Tax=Pedobacter sp. UYP30 TaxID=1756400 RepID=UPI00339B4BCE